MDSVLIPRTSDHNRVETHLRRCSLSKGKLTVRVDPLPQTPVPLWGRHHRATWLGALGCVGIMLLCPCLVIFYWIALSTYSGEMTSAFQDMIRTTPIAWFQAHIPRGSMRVSLAYCAWLFFQAALYQFLPCGRNLSLGQPTPAGYVLQYNTNGFLAWVVTHALYFAFSYSGFLNPAIIARNWEPLLISANLYGFFLSGFAYLKAHLSSSHPRDRKFSGSILYDIYMGIELNPRFGKLFDIKLFTNGRPGIVAWTLIDFSFVAYQYQLHGFVSNSIIIATYLHTIYVVDFFINEDWYVRTIDIAHDHFGFYLAWGSIVWLPSIYTSQTQYLAQHPVHLSNTAAVALTFVGTSGYVLFRWVNHQKNIARRTQGKCMIWGAPAKVMKLKYKTTDGFNHESLFLVSGWWGVARHMNYMGDLVLSYCMCGTCGFTNLLPWIYAIFMTILLVHRCWRDEERCSLKYGKDWDKYCELVRWRIVPGIW